MYTQRQLIICLIYTWFSVQDLCYLYHTTIHTPENSKTTGRELFGKWLRFTWVSIIFRIFVRILFGCLLGNLVHLYSSVMLIICLIYTWFSVQDLCYLYHTTIHTPENSKTTGRELFGKWLRFTWVSIIFRIFVRILFGCLLGNLVHLYSSVMPRICSSCSFLFLFYLVFFFAFFCFCLSFLLNFS